MYFQSLQLLSMYSSMFYWRRQEQRHRSVPFTTNWTFFDKHCRPLRPCLFSLADSLQFGELPWIKVTATRSTAITNKAVSREHMSKHARRRAMPTAPREHENTDTGGRKCEHVLIISWLRDPNCAGEFSNTHGDASKFRPGPDSQISTYILVP